MNFSLLVSNRRIRFIQEIDSCILLLGRLHNGRKVELSFFRVRNDRTLELRLSFQGHQLVLPNNDHVLVSDEFDDLIEQLDQIKIIAGFGGLDGALATAETYAQLNRRCAYRSFCR